MNTPTHEPSPSEGRPNRDERWLRCLGVFVLVLCLLGGLAKLAWALRSPEEANVAAFGLFGVYVALGLALAGLLFGLAAMIRYLDSLQSALIRVEKFQYEIGVAGQTRTAGPTEDPSLGDATLPLFEQPAISETPHGAAVSLSTIEPATGASTQMQELVQLLKDIRDNSLLSEDERREKRLRAEEIEFAQTRETALALSSQGDFPRARQIVENLKLRYPDSQQIGFLIEQLESDRERYESDDILRSTKQVEDLISISAWPRARQVVQQLQVRHPDSAEARQLLLRLEREHRLFQDEQRRRMHAEVQRFVSRKRWEEALAAARTFVERFPGSPEAEAFLMQIPMLEANAQVEHRQQMEAQIMDYAKHGRYIEAVGLARQLIQRYPDSPQADALRAQLSRLEELATNPDAPPARVRIE